MGANRGADRTGGSTRWAVLSTPPERRWPDGALHHGVRVLLLLVAAVIVTVLFPREARRQSIGQFTLGMVPDEAILADFTFAIPKAEDELERDRREATALVPPTFQYRPEAADSVQQRLQRFFAELEEAVTSSPRPQEAAQTVLSVYGIPLSGAQLTALSDIARRGLVSRTALQAASRMLPLGVANATDGDRITTDRVAVRQDGQERLIPRDSVFTVRDFHRQASELLPRTTPPDLVEFQRLVLIRFFEPTYVLDAVTTEADWQAARASVPPTKGYVMRGEAVVQAHEQIGETELERLNAYYRELEMRGLQRQAGLDPVRVAGSGLLNFLILGIFGLHVFFFRSDIYVNFRWVLLFTLLTLAFAAAASLIAHREYRFELIPIGFVTLAVAMLWDGRIALILALMLSVLIGAQTTFFDFPVLAITLGGGTAAALSVRVVRRRAQTWVFIAVISGAYAAVILALGPITVRPFAQLLTSCVYGAVSATASAMLAMGFMPVFEWFTRITTDQTLLEWADPNRPLLRRLALEAPGTYAHTINVANLAEAAATAIQANGLLARVGTYYHDIGKVLRPQYFVENQPSGRNPHDKLKPTTSAGIVREHVVEGLKLAQEARLPDSILSFITEHHGTQAIGYFYEKAQEEGETDLHPQDFHYPGPRPRSKETAIAMLADSVESAARVLQDPTPDRIRALVDRIVDDRIASGQLDEAPLTLAEIATIRNLFVKVIVGMHHQRLDYPATQDVTENPSTPAAAQAAL
ncbi:MAG: HDIG domain-containing protein [Gemmatimonadetes bacterium]|nr:HDIG domain-containing protein [Gemmatimonadota bacterium]